jgi:hypothetical protein
MESTFQFCKVWLWEKDKHSVSAFEVSSFNRKTTGLGRPPCSRQTKPRKGLFGFFSCA